MSDERKQAFVELVAPLAESLAEALAGASLADPEAARQAIEAASPFTGELVGQIRDAAVEGLEAGWLTPRENQGVRYGRVAKDAGGFSIDAVRMDAAGPRHRHPQGEIDLCFALDGEPRFDGHGEGWVVYGEGSAHVPTVAGGTMLILYFLPGGAIEWL